MTKLKYGPEMCYEDRVHRRLHIMYTRKTRERRVFMDDLNELRRLTEKRYMRKFVEAIGPAWYQALSVPQRNALDRLDFSIYQDLLEGRPVRSAAVMKEIGIFPRPHTSDLMNCLYVGREDPKEMLAQLYLTLYGYPIDGKRLSYELNARLILTAIFYLGFDHLIQLLREKFRPDPVDDVPKPKPKPKKEPPLKSPYLQKLIAGLYVPPVRKRAPPPPLPNLDDLNDPYEDEPTILKPTPPPPPPPAPKKRLPRTYCDRLAGVNVIQPYEPDKPVTAERTKRQATRKFRSSKMLGQGKKVYGLGLGTPKQGKRFRKLKVPRTVTENSQYTITGVYKIRNKTCFVLANIVVLPPNGNLIHGGYKTIGTENVNIHCGFRDNPPTPKPDLCNCLKTWQSAAMDYVKSTKCTCGHFYDYGNEGTFPPEELPFFVKPTRNTPYQFNYPTILDTDPKRLQVEKEFKNLWYTDSVLHVDDGTMKKAAKKKKKKSSTTCLGQKPRPQDYLRCAIRLMKRQNVAARLPDVHLVPELKEWMRRRIYGPITRSQKDNLYYKSSVSWQIMTTLDHRSYGHVYPTKDSTYSGTSNWSRKQSLNDQFRKYVFQYKMKMFKSLSHIVNMYWATMCQAQLPDKKFREIYFSYLYARVEDLQFLHPYNTRETIERQLLMARRRYYCPPAGVEPKD